MSQEDMMQALRAFAVDVAINWRDASPAAISAMINVAKLDMGADKVGELVSKLAELDGML